MASINKRPNGKWRAQYYDSEGKQHTKHFPRKIDAQQWLDEITASLVRQDYIAPSAAKITVGEWCDMWLSGYQNNRLSTIKAAQVHINVIKAEFAAQRLADVKPSQVKRWTAKMQSEGKAPSYVYAVYRRFAQIMGDAVHDDLLRKSPCSRKTSPGAATQRAYVATTEQVWELHDLFPEHLRPAVLLGAFAGLRVSEAVALRVEDVDFMRGIISPAIQYPNDPLKTETSRMPIPIPNELALMLSAAIKTYGSPTIVCNEVGEPVSPWTIERAIRNYRRQVSGLSPEFRFHDLRHYFASLLIGSGLDVKVVQTRLRHANATTTLNTYGHLWPDSDETARAAVSSVLARRKDRLRTEDSI